MQTSVTNPYVYDRPLTDFKHRHEYEQVYRAVKDNGQSAILYGPDRVGKTSLLLRLAIDYPGFVNISVDTLMRATSLGEYLLLVAQMIAQRLNMPKPSNPFADPDRFQQEFLFHAIAGLESTYGNVIRLILCVDDFDSLLNLAGEKKFTQQRLAYDLIKVFEQLILKEPRLGFIFTSSVPYKNYRLDSLNFLDRFPVIKLSMLDRESARQLITAPSESVRYDSLAVERIMELANGHPYFTQLLCSKAFDAARAASTSDVPLVTQTLVDSVVPDVLREGENVFENLWRVTPLNQRSFVASLADLSSTTPVFALPFNEQSSTSPQTFASFIENGILEYIDERYRFVLPLFAMWVRERKPLQQTIEEANAQESAQQTEQRNEILVNFALNDRPVGEDKLGYDDYAKAFAQVLANPDTKTPLTIGIYGEWGMGKSFLMEKIKEQLKKVKGEIEEDRKNKGLKNKDYPDFHFVHFNAWVYSGSENLWAGLVTKLYSEVESYFGARSLSWHFLRENLRGKVWKMLGLISVYGILAVTLSLLLDYNKVQQSWDTLQIAINTFIGAGLGISALAALSPLVKAINDLFSTVILIRSEQLAALSSRKDFRDKIGFMADIKTEIGRIGNMLNAGKEGRPVRFVIFIDDLDRCPPAKAVEVLEAIMLLLADDDGIPFVIFLGIDARVLVKAIEERYGKVLVEAGITGYEYLDKIVQIPFRIPPANEEALKNYVESLLWRSDKERMEAKEVKEKREKEEKERKEKEERESREAKEKAQEVKQGVTPKIESGEAVVGAAASSQTHTEGAGAVTASPDQKLPAQSDQVARESPKVPEVKIQSIEVPFKDEEQTAFKDFSRYYTPNPRRIKRIVNIYRIVRLLAGEQSAEFRRKMIKWVILSEQWPYRVAWVLQKIEDEYQLSHDLGATISLWSVFESVQQRVAEGAETFVNLDGDKEVFEVFAKLEPLITVGDIKQLRMYTFNLNPALQSEVIKAATVKSVSPAVQLRTNFEESLPKQMA